MAFMEKFKKLVINHELNASENREGACGSNSRSIVQMNNDSDLQKAKNIETVEGTRRSYQKSFIYSNF
jgi:hypothetical protein